MIDLELKQDRKIAAVSILFTDAVDRDSVKVALKDVRDFFKSAWYSKADQKNVSDAYINRLRAAAKVKTPKISEDMQQTAPRARVYEISDFQ